MEQSKLEFTGLRKYLFWIMGSYVILNFSILIALPLFNVIELKELLTLMADNELERKFELKFILAISILWIVFMVQYSRWVKGGKIKTAFPHSTLLSLLAVETIYHSVGLLSPDTISAFISLCFLIVNLYIFLPAFLQKEKK